MVDDDDIVDSAALSPLAGAVPLAWEMRFHVILARRPASPGYASLGSALVGQGAVAVEMSEAERSLFVARPVSLPPGRAQPRGARPAVAAAAHPRRGGVRGRPAASRDRPAILYSRAELTSLEGGLVFLGWGALLAVSGWLFTMRRDIP